MIRVQLSYFIADILYSKKVSTMSTELDAERADPGFFLGGGAPLRNDVTDRYAVR